MRKLCTVLLLPFVLSNITCNNNLSDQLQGYWICRDDIDCPDVIFFHKSGRYVITNDCGSTHHWIPVIERGNWIVKNRDIILENRTFGLRRGESLYNDYRMQDTLSVANISDTALSLAWVNANGTKRGSDYERLKYDCVRMERFFYSGCRSVTLAVPCYLGRNLLKLGYKLDYPRASESYPGELIVEDQAGHELWRKAVIFKSARQEEEILISDIPEIIDLERFIVKVKTESNIYWELRVKLY